MNEEQMQRQADIMDPQEVLGLMREVEELKADKRQLELVVNSHANMRDATQEQLRIERMALAEAIHLISQVVASGELERTSPTLHAKLESCFSYNAQPAAGVPVAWQFEEYVYASGIGYVWTEKLERENLIRIAASVA